MGIIFAVLAILCGAVVALDLLDKPDKQLMVLGIGVICAALAAVVDTGVTWFKSR